MFLLLCVTVVDGVALPEGRWRVIGSGNLQLSSIVANDTALYVCTLHEASISAAASLTVYGKYLLRSVGFMVNKLLVNNLDAITL